MDNKIEYLKKQLVQAEISGDKALYKKIYRSLVELGDVETESSKQLNKSASFEKVLISFENENKELQEKSKILFLKKRKIARWSILIGILAMVMGILLLVTVYETFLMVSFPMTYVGLALFSYGLIAGLGITTDKKWATLKKRRYDAFINENDAEIEALAKCMYNPHTSSNAFGSIIEVDKFGTGHFIEIQSQKGSFYIDDYIYIGNTKYKILHIINRQNGQPITHFNEKNPSVLVCISKTKLNIDFVPYVLKV